MNFFVNQGFDLGPDMAVARLLLFLIFSARSDLDDSSESYDLTLARFVGKVYPQAECAHGTDTDTLLLVLNYKK